MARGVVADATGHDEGTVTIAETLMKLEAGRSVPAVHGAFRLTRPGYERSETSPRPMWFPHGAHVSHPVQFGPIPLAFGAVASAVQTASPILPKVVEPVSDQAESEAVASSSASPMEGLTDPPPVGADDGASSETPGESRDLARDAARVPSKKQSPKQPHCPRGWREMAPPIF